MGFSEEQIKTLAPNPAAFSAGKKLSSVTGWEEFARSERAIWGAIRGSGKKPYLVEIDRRAVAFKCSCPSRQFPCKHAIGLMLLYGADGSGFKETPEPEWVSEWLDKRQVRQEKKDREKEPTEEEKEQSALNKEKTLAKRLDSVQAGARDLELWLKDLIRIGLLELPNKKTIEFTNMAARMIDAKAPGLAGWVRALGELNYRDQNGWQDDALKIMSRLFLLIQAIHQYDQLDPWWQQTIRNLAGWSQSGKELLTDASAETVKDYWLVIGQEERTNDDVISQRNWLVGSQSGRKALILNFATRFSSFETPVMPGSVMEAELAFFPSIQPLRATIKMQRSIGSKLPQPPEFQEDWLAFHRELVEQTRMNPWLSDPVCLIRKTRLVLQQERWAILDSENHYLLVEPSFTFDQCLKWLSVSGNRQVDFAGVYRNRHILPLGLWIDGDYILL